LTRSDGEAQASAKLDRGARPSLNAARLGDADYSDLAELVWGMTDGSHCRSSGGLLPANLVLVAASVLGGAGWSRFRRA
jgi:hypothetical protein